MSSLCHIYVQWRFPSLYHLIAKCPAVFLLLFFLWICSETQLTNTKINKMRKEVGLEGQLSIWSAHPWLIEAEIAVLDRGDVVERVDGQVLRLRRFWVIIIIMTTKQMGDFGFLLIMKTKQVGDFELIIIMKTKQMGRLLNVFLCHELSIVMETKQIFYCFSLPSCFPKPFELLIEMKTEQIFVVFSSPSCFHQPQ